MASCDALDACESGSASTHSCQTAAGPGGLRSCIGTSRQYDLRMLDRAATEPAHSICSSSHDTLEDRRTWYSDPGGSFSDLGRNWWNRTLSEEHKRGFVRTLALTLGSMPIRAPTQTFLCCICLENVPVADRLVMAQCGRHAHASCRDCLRTYLRLRIEEARVDELHCPCAGKDGCKAVAAEDELQSWLGEQAFEKFQRFKHMHANPMLRSCPECSCLCSPEAGADGGVIAEMCCSSCGCSFCYYHSNAHAPGATACAEYERSVVKKQLLGLLDSDLQGAKRCPKCSFLTEKASGCNHMTCRCKADWCWVCGQELSNVGWHYNPANPSGCTQFQDELTSQREVRLMVLCKVLCLPAVFISVLFMILFALLLVVLLPVPAAMRFKEVGSNTWIGTAMVLVGAPFVAFNLIWGAIGLVMCALLLPCGVGEVHVQFIVGVPLVTVLAVGEGIMGPESVVGRR